MQEKEEGGGVRSLTSGGGSIISGKTERRAFGQKGTLPAGRRGGRVSSKNNQRKKGNSTKTFPLIIRKNRKTHREGSSPI